MTCTTCSNDLDTNDAFCGSCGTKVMSPSVQTTPAAVPGEMQGSPTFHEVPAVQGSDQSAPQFPTTPEIPKVDIPAPPVIPPVQNPSDNIPQSHNEQQQ